MDKLNPTHSKGKIMKFFRKCFKFPTQLSQFWKLQRIPQSLELSSEKSKNSTSSQHFQECFGGLSQEDTISCTSVKWVCFRK